MTNKQVMSRVIIIIGGFGSGKTTKATNLMGNRPYKIIYANELDNFDVYSYPKKYGLIIEEVEFKPDTNKILDIINVKGDKLILTSVNEKEIPNSIMNKCRKLNLGPIDFRQTFMLNAPNKDVVKCLELDMRGLTWEWLRNTDRDEVQKLLKHNKPSPIQILSWVEPNVDTGLISLADSIKWKWNRDYFYEILSYGYEGSYRGRLKFNKRRTFSPLPKICEKLGLKYSDSYLVKSLIMNDEYKEYATSKLDSKECKIIGIKKPRKKRESVRKLRDYNEKK